MTDSNETAWYVLNYIKPQLVWKIGLHNSIARFNAMEHASLDVFAPTFVEMIRHNGAVKATEKPLLFHYVFIRGDITTLKKLCGNVDGFSFVLRHDTNEKRYLTISNCDLASFRIIARFYGNKLPFYPAEDVELIEGDEVEVIDGPFAGLRGTFLSRKGTSQGNIIVCVAQNLATVAYDIKAEYVRVIRFSSESKRVYDQIDAIVPKLLFALRKHSESGTLSSAESSPLVMFCRRFEAVRTNNRKLNAKLQAILTSANMLLGNIESYESALEQYKKCHDAVTNNWTKALINLIIAIPTNDCQLLRQGLSLIPNNGSSSSKIQALVRKEYEHYKPILNFCTRNII